MFLQEITSKLESLEIYYKRETEQIKSDIARLSTDLRELEESDYDTADEYEQIQAHVVPVARKVGNIIVTDSSSFEKGYVAKITNTYKGEYGTVGIVKTISPDFITIVDCVGKEHRRAPKNLIILAQDVDEYGEWRAAQGLKPIHFRQRKGKERKSKKFW